MLAANLLRAAAFAAPVGHAERLDSRSETTAGSGISLALTAASAEVTPARSERSCDAQFG